MSIQSTSKRFVFFRPDGDAVYNVHLDWLGENTRSAMAEGFKEAADRIVISLQDEARHPDAFIYPVAYLYRHYLELQFKNLILGAADLLREPLGKCELIGHDLTRVWQRAQALILRVWPNGDASYLDPVAQAVHEFALLDLDGQCFRYFENRQHQRNLQNAPRILSLDNLMERMDEVFDILSGCEMGMAAYANGE